MKKLLAVILSLTMVLSLAACGGGNANADPAYEGKYLSVAGEMMGMVLTGDEIAGFEIVLESGGSGELSVDGESGNLDWSNEGDTITIDVDGEILTGTYADDMIKFVDFLGMGMDLTFAREGADIDPTLYMAESDKKLLGTWTSHTVTDVLGDDASAETDPAGLVITFNPDYTASGSFGGSDLGLEQYSWSMLDTWGSFDDADDCVISSWDIAEDGSLEVTYDDGDNYYIFICGK